MPQPHDHADDLDPFDAEVQAAARAYHTPPPVPVDAMWEAIQARRASATSTPPEHTHAHAADVVVQHLAVRRPGAWGRAARRWTPLAAAVAVLLAVGVQLGRYSAAPNAPAEARAVVATRVSSPSNRTERTPSVAPELAVATPPDSPRGTGSASPVTHAPTEHALGDRRPVSSPTILADAPYTTAPDAGDAASAPLRAAADQHLADAEALLTAFDATGGGARGQPGGAAPDSAWARDLLTTTRLLLDSPAGRDPARRSLLETLELVLVQIARLPHADTPTERALIDRAIRSGDLMARLRTAVPSGPGHGTAGPDRTGFGRAAQGT